MARGHIYRRGRADGSPGNWNAVIDVPITAGERRRQITRTFPTERQAHRWLADMVSSRESARCSERSVGEHLGAWLDSLVFARASTKATYRAHLERHLVPAFADAPISALRAEDVERLVHDFAAQGLAPATIKRILSTLSVAMRAAVRSGLIAHNPAVDVAVPTAQVRPLPAWTLEQCRQFLMELGNDSLDVCLRLALVTGMRRGELLGLRWGDFDLDEAVVHVTRSRVAVGGSVIEGPPKSASSVRAVYLDPSTVEALRQLRRSKRRIIALGTESRAMLFTDVDGVPWTPWWLTRAFNKRIDALGLERIRFHDLRHASATMGLASGETLREISARLGHADVSVTARIYADVVPDLARASAIRRANYLANPQHHRITQYAATHTGEETIHV